MKAMLPALFLFATSITAIAADVTLLQPSVELKVAPAEQAGRYQVDIAVINLATMKSLASPMLLVESGEPGSVRVVLPGEMAVTISVTVDGAAQRLSYKTQILDQGRAISNSSAQVAFK
ncbi:MAG: hypothetical protein ABIP56_01425 [Dokdonella sp.]